MFVHKGYCKPKSSDLCLWKQQKSSLNQTLFNLLLHFGKSETSINWTCLNRKTTVLLLKLRQMFGKTGENYVYPRYELRRCVRNPFWKVCGMCVRLIFRHAMCHCTFAHFLEQNRQKMLLVVLKKTISECPIPFQNILSCFRTSFLTLEHLFLLWKILSCFRTSIPVLENLVLF